MSKMSILSIIGLVNKIFFAYFLSIAIFFCLDYVLGDFLREQKIFFTRFLFNTIYQIKIFSIISLGSLSGLVLSFFDGLSWLTQLIGLLNFLLGLVGLWLSFLALGVSGFEVH